MTLKEAVLTIFNDLLKALDSIHIPTFTITFKQFMIGLFLVCISIALVKQILNASIRSVGGE